MHFPPRHPSHRKRGSRPEWSTGTASKREWRSRISSLLVLIGVAPSLVLSPCPALDVFSMLPTSSSMVAAGELLPPKVAPPPLERRVVPVRDAGIAFTYQLPWVFAELDPAWTPAPAAEPQTLLAFWEPQTSLLLLAEDPWAEGEMRVLAEEGAEPAAGGGEAVPAEENAPADEPLQPDPIAVEEEWLPAEGPGEVPPEGVPAVAEGDAAVRENRTPLLVEQEIGECEIFGEVSDATTLDPVPGAIVTILGTGREAETDAQGKFRIDGLPPGDFTVEALKPGYSTTTAPASPRPGQAAEVRLALRVKPGDDGDGEFMLAEESVIGEYNETSQGDFNLDIQAAPNITAGIGRAEFSRAGVSDAGDAVSKISGANIVGGKYAVVRGLGDRYSNTLVNGAQISSADPSKKAVQLDLFPSDLLESVAIFKTFTPDLPAEFAGGTVAIETLRFPSERILSFELGTGWNTNLDGATMRTVPGREFNFLGETRDAFSPSAGTTEQGLPVGYQGTRPLATAPAAQRQAAATAAAAYKDIHLSGGMRPGYRDPDPKQSLSLMYADIFELGRGIELGSVLAFTRDQEDKIREDVQVGRLFNPGADGVSGTADDFLNREGTEDQFTSSLNWGALGSFGLRMGERHEIGVTLFKNSTSEDRVVVADRQRRQDGDRLAYLPPARTPGNAGAFLYQGYEIIEPLKRELMLEQFNGRHILGDPDRWAPEFEWALSHSDSLEDRPHSRSLLYYILDYTDPRIRDERGDIFRPELGVLVTAADVPAATQGTGTLQSFRETLSTDETARNLRMDLTLPILKKDDQNFWNIKIGTNEFTKDREVRGRLFSYEIPGLLNQKLVAGLGELGTDYLNQWDSGFGLDGEPRFNGWTGQGGRIRSDRLFLSEATKTGRTVRNVDAFSEVDGFYAMTTVRQGPWNIVGGARIEEETRGYEVLKGLNQGAFVRPRTEQSNRNVLPGITASRTFGADDSVSTSIGWSRTIARPTFYEFAPVQTEDQATGDVIVGNPDLTDTLIDNFDIRAAWQDDEGDLLAINLFHKSMDGPIAQAYEALRKTWVNGTTGRIQGVELEARKTVLERWSLTGNYTYINSLLQYEQRIGSVGSQLIDSSFEGQPEQIINVILGYDDSDSGFGASLVYNFTGSYLTGVPLNNTSPAILRDGYSSLDLIMSKRLDLFEGVGIVKLKFGNLLDETDTERFEGTGLVYRSFKAGRSVTLSFEMEF